MADIRIRREHSLGMVKAREVALGVAAHVETRFGMECTLIKGEVSDTLAFKRSGVTGTLIVAPDHFDLNAQLGFLLGAFASTIESEIVKNLDKLLAKSGPAKTT